MSPFMMNNARYVVVLITKRSVEEDSEMTTCGRLVASAIEREKPVYALIEDFGHSYEVEKKSTLPSFMADVVTITLNLNTMDNTKLAVSSALYWLLSSIDAYEERQRLYDTLATIQPNTFHSQFCDQYSDRLERILQCIQRELRHISATGARKALIKEALGCAEALAHVSENYGSVGSRSARIRVNCLSILSSIRDDCPELCRKYHLKSADPFFCAVVIRLIYLDYCIRGDCADTMTYGDVTELQDSIRLAMASEQDDCYETMRRSLDEISDEHYQELYSIEEQRLIQSVEKSLLSRPVSGCDLGNPFLKKPQPLKAVEEANTERNTLVSIAYCILESNQLFDQFVRSDTPTSYLVSLRTSYERLSHYCSVIGASELRVDLIDRICQINQLIEMGNGGEARHSEDRAPVTEIKSLLGISKPSIQSFDAFISYSHADEDVATKVYRFLRESSKEPFFDRMSLPEMSDSDYEEAIMEALDKSKHLILVLSDLSALKSHWINLEVKTFMHEVTEGRKVDGNVLLVVSESVQAAIAESNKLCLPIRLRSSEILQLGSYRSTLLSYL